MEITKEDIGKRVILRDGSERVIEAFIEGSEYPVVLEGETRGGWLADGYFYGSNHISVGDIIYWAPSNEEIEAERKAPFQWSDTTPVAEYDFVNRPKHYNHINGVECIEITEHFNFNRGNAIKYIWRAGHKNNELEDLKKAEWYLKREIKRIENENTPTGG